MRHRSTPDPRFGEAMRELLAKRGMSYRVLAARTFHGKSYLHELAAGKKAPTPEIARRIDLALGARGRLTELVVSPRVGAPLLMGDGWGRSDNERLAHVLVSETPGPDNALRLAHEWLVAEPPQIYELRAGRRVGAATVATIERRVQQLRLLDDHVGGDETYPVLSGELAATSALLREAAYPAQLGRRLLVVTADLCQLAGFVAADTGRYADAKRLHAAGVRAAHAGGDTESAANNLSSIAYVEANSGDPRTAVLLARSAYAGVRHTGRATVRALLLERLAWAHARAGDALAAERTLGTVEEVYPVPRPADDPPWAYWLSPEEVQVMAGRVWTELRRPLRAVPILERATAGYNDDVPRETALYLTWLAEALVQAGEIEAAADRATKALRLARRAHSHRTMERVATVRASMAPYADALAVAAFEEEYLDDGPSANTAETADS
ncbi:MAG TPA: helix-turn-helix transcriptional regulator [Micromonosporaceae bacterium]|nr:helix-turn-helix transcriptional regulator [Micromonosporaceae bacterium]